MNTTAPQEIPAWAYERAYSRSYKHTLNAEKLKTIYTEDNNPEARVMRAFAAHIAATEQPPVDPDVELVVGIVNAFENCTTHGVRERAFDCRLHHEDSLAVAVTYYKQNKESAQ